MIEILEHRIAPAALLSPSKIAYTDTDGDTVTITFSKAVFTGDAAAQLAKANEVFKFDTGNVTAGDMATRQQLQRVDFTKFPVIASVGSTVNGVGLTIEAVQVGTANGLAHVGAISGLGVSLGAIVIDGDLGQIDAGGSGLTIGVKGLTVASLGAVGTGTQIAVANPTAENPAPDLVSTITGELTFLKVLGDVKDARIRVVDGKNAQGQITTAAKIGALTIGGSLVGSAGTETTSDDTGEITSERGIGSIVIGGNVTGGGGVNSGRISAAGSIVSVQIAGDLVGGVGMSSGSIMSNGNIGAVKISSDVRGGGGENSGTLRAFGSIASLIVGGDMVSGVGPRSGFVSAIGAMQKVFVTGDIDGSTANAGARSAGIYANGLPSVTVLGNIFGGAFSQTGSIESGRTIGNVVINGSVEGGVGDGSGVILAQGAIGSVLIKGHLIGSDGTQSGLVRSGLDPLQPGSFGSMTVLGKVSGAAGDNSGSIISGGTLGKVTIGTSTTATLDALGGGSGIFSGAISARGKIGSVKITGHVQGGDGPRSGVIASFDRTDALGEYAGELGSISISGHLAGGLGVDSGSLLADGGLAKFSVAALTGGSVQTGRGLLSDGDVGTIKILGDVSMSASVLVGGSVKSLVVSGNADAAFFRFGESAQSLTFSHDISNASVSAGTNLARITVRGNVSGSHFLAGYDLSGTASNPDAQIGVVSVSGNWASSSIAAGVAVGSDAGFGNQFDMRTPGFDDPGIISKIASVAIRGAATGALGESTGIVAQLVRSVKIGPTKFALNASADAQVLTVGDPEEGVTIREVV